MHGCELCLNQDKAKKHFQKINENMSDLKGYNVKLQMTFTNIAYISCFQAETVYFNVGPQYVFLLYTETETVVENFTFQSLYLNFLLLYIFDSE